MKRKTIPISFRVDEDLLRQIDAQCQPYGISRGDWVRGVLIAKLHATDQGLLLAQLEFVINAVQQLSVATAKVQATQERSLFALLRKVAGLESDEARTIVKQVVRSQGTKS